MKIPPYLAIVERALPRDVKVFLAIAFGGAWAVEIILRPLLPFVVRAALAMLMPALAALLVRGPLCRLGFADAGVMLRFKQSGRIYAAAYVFMPAAAIVGAVISVTAGLQHFGIQSPGQVLESFGAAGLTNAPPPDGKISAFTVIAIAIGALSISIPMNMMFTFGEEFGWRGYLLVRLTKFGRLNATLIVGVIWGIWHAPLILFDGYVYPGHPIAGVAMMCVFTTSLSVLFAWFRFRSGSIWPAVLAHAAFNAQASLSYIVLSPANSLLRPPAGLCTIIPLALLALWVVVTGKLDDPSIQCNPT